MRAVTVEADEWSAQALELAREELTRRGLRPPAPADVPPEPPPLDKRRPSYKAGIPLVIMVSLLLKLLLILLR
jgi:hypothetical protein